MKLPRFSLAQMLIAVTAICVVCAYPALLMSLAWYLSFLLLTIGTLLALAVVAFAVICLVQCLLQAVSSLLGRTEIRFDP